MNGCVTIRDYLGVMTYVFVVTTYAFIIATNLQFSVGRPQYRELTVHILTLNQQY